MSDEDVKDAPAEGADDTSSTDTQKTTDVGNETILEDAKAEADAKAAPKPEVQPDWPEDWRDKLAGDDKKFRKQLDRYRSPVDAGSALRSAQLRISSGDLREALPENATDEQIAAYRKDNGIPEKAEGYLESLPDGLVIGEDDKEIVGSFVERVHGKHADPAVVSEAISWYYDLQEQEAAKQAEIDTETKQKNDDELRAEWGAEYRSNINSVYAFLDSAPSTDDGMPLKELLLGSRLADGTPVGNHPTMLRWLAQMASDANPAGFVSPGAGGSQVDSVKDEIAKIEKVMREDRPAYDKDIKMQERLRKLYEAEEKLSA